MTPLLRTTGRLLAALLPAAAAAAATPPTTLPAPRLFYEPPAGPTRDPGDPPPIGWADSNRMVGVLGGHAGHLRGPAPPAKAPR